MKLNSLKQICEEAQINENQPLIEKASFIFSTLNKNVKFPFLSDVFEILKTDERHEYMRLDGAWVCEMQGMSYFLMCDSVGSIYDILKQKEIIQLKKNKTIDDIGILARYKLFAESIKRIEAM